MLKIWMSWADLPVKFLPRNVYSPFCISMTIDIAIVLFLPQLLNKGLQATMTADRDISSYILPEMSLIFVIQHKIVSLETVNTKKKYLARCVCVCVTVLKKVGELSIWLWWETRRVWDRRPERGWMEERIWYNSIFINLITVLKINLIFSYTHKLPASQIYSHVYMSVKQIDSNTSLN